MRTLTFRTRALVLATGVTTVLALAPAGSAWAFWRAPGAGSASGPAATVDMSAQPFTVTGLYPGASRDVAVTVQVSSPVAVRLTGVGVGAVLVSDGATPCSGSAVTFTLTTPLPTTVPAGAGSVTVNGTVAMAATAQNGCQGRVFTIPLTVTGQI